MKSSFFRGWYFGIFSRVEFHDVYGPDGRTFEKMSEEKYIWSGGVGDLCGWRWGFMVKLRVSLLTGRTLEQGRGKEYGKLSEEYWRDVAVCEMDPEGNLIFN